jgi:hypothetical protein
MVSRSRSRPWSATQHWNRLTAVGRAEKIEERLDRHTPVHLIELAVDALNDGALAPFQGEDSGDGMRGGVVRKAPGQAN